VCRPIRVIAALLLVPVLVAGCTSSPPKAPPPPGGTRTGTSGAATLAGAMTTALQEPTSAHLDIDTGSLAGKSTADIELTHGKTTASDITLSVNGQSIEVVTVGGTSYAKVPGGAKPWAIVSATSSNAIAKGLATPISMLGATTSLDAVVALVAKATSFQDKGSDTIDGRPATHYALTVDPSQGSTNPQLAQVLALLGKTPLPVDLWVDDQSRPVKFAINLSFGGQKIAITAVVSKYDAPLTIAAPPADEVSTS
jgi:hypothetical protein